MKETGKIFVIGHKNPDTDSICSAIAYAALKNQTDEGEFVAKRAGEINNETKYVLDFFQVETPAFISHVGTQVKDVAIKPTPTLDGDISIKNAWKTMRDLQEATMPIVDDGILTGIISVKCLIRNTAMFWTPLTVRCWLGALRRKLQRGKF